MLYVFWLYIQHFGRIVQMDKDLGILGWYKLELVGIQSHFYIQLQKLKYLQ